MIRHGGMVRCDMVTVAKHAWTKPCQGVFYTYSVASLARPQALRAGWTRPKVKFVRWPGLPPAGDNVKVDLCPTCSALVMSAEDHRKLKDQRKAEKLAAKLEKKRESKKKIKSNPRKQ